ncbi:hypothetical protein AD936_18140 [Gluconobacter japonicus]|nr:hypothetical protein AD936_18140 [Gluconobacter japonicus]
MFLIHSMAHFSSIYLPVLKMTGARKICEIGSELGGNTSILLEYADGNHGHIICIDPCPDNNFYEKLINKENISFIKDKSINAICTINCIDVWFVDGDHNWYTVFNELSLIDKVSKRDGKPFLAFVHDVDWPSGRRDLYYDPSSIPENFLHDYSWELGTVPEQADLISGGFRGAGAFAWAHQSGGEKNGVRTAIEDFIADGRVDEVEFLSIPGVFGLGVIASKNHPFLEEIKSLLEPFANNPLLIDLEKNRLENYLELIRRQDEGN